MTGDVALALAASVRQAVQRAQPADRWTPGAVVDDDEDDAAERLATALRSIGWEDIDEEDIDEEAAEGRAEAGVAVEAVAHGAVELGRVLASLSHVDRFLGGSPIVDGLVRHGRPGRQAVEILAGDRLRAVELIEVEPVAYGDASGVAMVVRAEPVEADPMPRSGKRRLELWRAAMTGYLAGLSAGAFEACLEHVTNRQAFGAPLAALDVVQMRLADAATALDGVRLLVGEDSSWPVLCHAADVAVSVTATCHQLTGALGYTMAYPLQRYSRRARALRLWTERCAEAADAAPLR